MARSSMCEKWLTRAVTDAGLRELPPLARLVWFELVAWATVAPVRGCIRLPGSVAAWVSRLVSQSETEAETALRTLAEFGLLTLEADGRTVWLAGAREGLARAEAARINGRNGGRRRKDESAEEYKARKQGTLLLPVPGGRAETQETEAEPTPEISHTRARQIDDSENQNSSPSSSPPLDARAVVALGEELAALAGLNPTRGGYDFSPLRGWLAAGATPAMLRDLVARVAGRAKGPIGSLNFFAQEVRKALEAAPPPPSRSGFAESLEEHVRRGDDPRQHPTLEQWRAGLRPAA